MSVKKNKTPQLATANIQAANKNNLSTANHPPTAYPIFFYLFAVLIIGLPITVSSHLFDPVLSNRLLFLVIYLIVFLLAFIYIKPKLQTGVPKPVVYVLGIGFAFIIWNMVSTYFAINPKEGLLEISKQLTYFLLIISVLLIVLINKNSIEPITKIMVCVALFHGLIGNFQFYDIAGRDLPTGLVSYPFGFNVNRNFYGSFLALCLPFVAYVFYSHKNIWQYLAGATITICLGSIVLSQTRSAWLSSFLILAFSSFLILIVAKINRVAWFKKLTILGLCVVAFLSFLIVMDTEGKLKKDLIERFTGTVKGIQISETEGLASGSSASNVAERIELWKKSKLIINDYPLMGVGRNNWKLILGKYGLADVKAYAAGTFIPDYPHNVYIYTAAETGIIGIALLLIFIFSICFLGYKIIKTDSDQKHSTIFLLTGLLCFGVDSMFSFPDTRVEHMMLLSIFIGLILGNYCHVNKNSIMKFNKIIMFIITGAVLAFNLFVATELIKYEKHFMLADANEKEKKYNNLLIEAEACKSPVLSMGGHVLPVENLEIIAYKNLKKYPEAEKAYTIAQKKSPYLAQVYNNIGTVFIDNNQMDKATIVLEKAISIAPLYVVPKQNLAVLHYNKKQYDTCIKYLKQINLDNPPFFTDVLKTISIDYYNKNEINKCLDAIDIYKKYSKQKPWFDSLLTAVQIKAKK